jgi:hypothetical protein
LVPSGKEESLTENSQQNMSRMHEWIIGKKEVEKERKRKHLLLNSRAKVKVKGKGKFVPVL